jgi:hypothetical protein
LNKAASLAQMVVRVLGLVQLVLGGIVWTGKGDSLVPLHIVVGSTLVVALWVLAYLAFRMEVPTSLVILAAVWGLVLAAWGMSQEQILPETNHWITQVLHVVYGIGAVGVAEILGARIRSASSSAAN